VEVYLDLVGQYGEDPTPEVRDQIAIGLVNLDDIEWVVAKELLARMGNAHRYTFWQGSR
jgi:hypothetical protein